MFRSCDRQLHRANRDRAEEQFRRVPPELAHRPGQVLPLPVDRVLQAAPPVQERHPVRRLLAATRVIAVRRRSGCLAPRPASGNPGPPAPDPVHQRRQPVLQAVDSLRKKSAS
jgi:hypothetical protein